MPRSGWVWLGIGAAYFFIPLAATLEFSLKEVSGYGLSSYREILSDPQFRDLLWVSFKLALATIVVSLLILIPGVYSVHLSFPRLRPLVEFLSVLPFVVPPIILIVGDHMPPLTHQASRLQFEPDRVPWILLKSRAASKER